MSKSGGKNKKRAQGRPIKNVVRPIPVAPEEIARALFRSADKKIPKEKGE